MLALAAYLVSGVDKLVVVRAKQHICTEYFIRFFNKIHNNQGYNSKHGKIQTIAWLSGEVRQTLTAVIDFINQAWSLYLHILITFLVFYQTVGAVISLIILACFALPALLVLTSRQRIQKLSCTNQADNIKLNEALPVQWDYVLFGNASRHHRLLDAALDGYFGSLRRYVRLEQVIVIAPVAVCVLAMVGYLSIADVPLVQLAMMVAVLPRALQLLGSVHTVATINTQFNFIKNKYQGVVNFLPAYRDLATHIQPDKLQIYSNKQQTTLTLEALFDTISRPAGTHPDHIRLTGANGAGKSSLLKLLKQHNPAATLITPDSDFQYTTAALSTGQEQLLRLTELIHDPQNTILLLDEWDANLDDYHITVLNQQLVALAKDKLIIEVRHHQGGQLGGFCQQQPTCR
ncbi:cytochrome c biogenesis protein CcmA [Moraxella cuniculi]|uniref:Cytochrome c biogenesis protein CcmA n=2 Tax=Moraxella cuniculi TaxID=34061 RepID=A0A3S4UJV9_9GAMM|nr:cytochrome c biogenesis protein CcmA [Moraxella cuniculi]